MELRYLRSFLVVVEEMNFIRAARRLHISQPPLTRQIQCLERELGVKLLEREGKRFGLTEAGRHFRAGAAHVLDEVALLERQTRLIGDSSATLVRLGYVGSMMFSLLPQLLAHLEAMLPEIRLDIVEMGTEEQAAALLSGRIDVGFMRSWVEREGIAFEPAGEESLSIVYPSAMDTGAAPALAAFAERPFVWASRSAAPGLAERIEELCVAAGFSPKSKYECGQLSSVLGLVASGLGWTILPAFSARAIKLEGVEVAPLPDKVMLGVAHRAGLVPERVRAVVAEAGSFLKARLAP